MEKQQINPDIWKDKLTNEVARRPLAGDRVDNANPTTLKGSFELSESISNQLRALSKENNKALYTILLTSLFALGKKYQGVYDHFVINTPSLEDGSEVRLLPVIAEIHGSKSVRDLLNQIKKDWIETLLHQHVPLQEAQNLTSGWLLTLPALHNQFQLPNEVAVHISVALNSSISLNWEADSREYSTVLMDQCMVHWQQLLEVMLRDMQIEIDRISIISEAEHKKLTQSWDGPEVNHKGATLIGLFADVVDKNPNETALIYEGKKLTYAELNDRANQIAGLILGIGNLKSGSIALYYEPSFDMIAGMLAAMKIGLPYVPISPDDPTDRVSFILKDSSANCILTHESLSNSLSVSCPVVCTDQAEEYEIEISTPSVAENDTVYVIYTSGTTGTPKGVEVLHKGVANYTLWRIENYDLKPGDITLQVFPYQFDGYGCNLYSTILSGASLLMVPDIKKTGPVDLLEKMTQHQVTNMCVTSGVYDLVLTEIQPETKLDQLRFVALAGDKPNRELIKRSKDLLSNISLTNEYGLTETSIGGLCSNELTSENPAIIGTVNTNNQVRILTENNQLLPTGAFGELCFAGDSVAQGYLNRPELNSALFVEDPFQAGNPMYRTGDLARWLPSGIIEFRGRKDDQVKVNGYRVEPLEIEACLREVDSISEATIITTETAEGENQLVGYYTATETIELATIKEQLSDKLPEYMVPGILMELDTIPLTSTGKLDKKALPEPKQNDLSSEGEEEIDSALEQELAEIWSSLIAVDIADIKKNSSFFELGGHSIKAFKLISQVQKKYSVALTLQELFDKPTLQDLVQAIQSQQDEEVVDDVPELIIDRKNSNEPFPLTEVQYAYWVGRKEAFSFGQVGAHGYFEFYVEDLDVPRFQNTIHRLIAQHDVLRMVVTPQGEQQVLAGVPDYEVPILDLRTMDPKEGEERFYAWREEMGHHVFSGETWPLFDLRVTIFEDSTYKIHYGTDGLVMDGESLSQFTAEFAHLYEEPEMELKPLSITFRDYMISEQVFKRGPEFLKSQSYWKNRIPDLPFAPELPINTITDDREKPKFFRRSHQMDKPTWEILKDKANKMGVTPSVLLISCFTEVLNYWSKSSHFILNLTLYNRIPFHDDVDRLLGDFTSLTLLEVDFRKQQSFRDKLKQVQKRLLQDLEHKYYGGIEVLREMQQYHNTTLMMPVVLTSLLGISSDEPEEGESVELPANDPRKEEYAISQTPQVWIDFQVGENHNGLWCIWDCVDKVFPEGMLDDMFASFNELLIELATEDRKWESKPLVTLPTSQKEIRIATNETAGTEPVQLLNHMVMEQTKLRPSAVAISSTRQLLTYGEFGHMVNVLAHELVKAEAKPNELIAIIMHKGWEQVVAALSIIESGAAYLPIDASFPEERINLLLEQGGAEIVLTTPEVAENNSFALVRKIMLVETDLLHNADPGSTNIVADPSDLAYVIFTSGSTGLPKGVAIDHRGATNTICDMNERFGITQHDKVLALSSLSFDLSVYDIFGILGAGGTIVIPQPDESRDPAAWYRYLEQEGVTLWNTVPAFVQILVEFIEGNGGDLSTLRNIWMSGDWIPVNLPDRIKGLNKEVKVTSLGGATEASIWSIYYYIDDVQPDWKSIPYGKPLKNQEFYVLDDHLNVCPNYATGDLYIGGIGLAQCYWRDEEKTNSSFITHPIWGKRLYKTGDTGRYLPDGNIEFQGREDSQVKIQGYRIELGEVESAINSHPEVKESTVIVRGERGNVNEMIAYVVPKSDTVLGGQVDHVGVVADPEVTITDEHERSLFKIEKKGLMALNGKKSIALPGAIEAITLSENVPSVEVQAGSLSLTELGKLLSVLRAKTSEQVTLSKYFYPSAGSLYPVQTYLEIPEKGVNGMTSGTYYFHPETYELQKVGKTSATKVQLHLVADLDAIKPLYGTLSADFVQLEAGYMGQLLMTSAAKIGCDPITVNQLNSDILSKAALKPVGSFMLQAVKEVEATTTFELNYNERKSYRSFQRNVHVEKSEIQRLGEVLAAAHQSLEASDLKVFLSVEDQQANGIEGGIYHLDVDAKAWKQLNSKSTVALFEGNEHLIKSAGLAVIFTGTQSANFQTGFLSQALMNVSIGNQIGWCAVGVVQQKETREVFDLNTNEVVLHSLVGGKVSAEQIQVPNSLEVVSPQESPEKILRDYLSERLPRYMVPTYWVGMERIPLTQNGKVDRKALPSPTITKDTFVAPETEVEIKLAEIWADLLDMKFEDVDLSRTFFEMGGHSLKATLMVNKILKELNVEVPLREIFEEDTIPNIADYIENQLWLKKEAEDVEEGEEFILD